MSWPPGGSQTPEKRSEGRGEAEIMGAKVVFTRRIEGAGPKGGRYIFPREDVLDNLLPTP